MTTTATRKMILLFVASFALQGCYPAAPEPQGKSHLPRYSHTPQEPVTPPIIQDDLYGVEGLRHACQRTRGAYFVESKSECFCQSQKGERPLVFSMNGSGSCAPIQYKHAQDNGACPRESFAESYLQGWIPGLNQCLSSVARGYRTSVSVELSRSVPGKEALALARYADHHLEDIFVKLWPTFEDYFFNSSVKFLVGRFSVGRLFIEDVLAPPAITEQQRYRTTFIEPEVGWVLNSLGHPQSQLPPVPSVPPALATRYPVAAIVSNIVSETRAGFSSKKISVMGDCRTSCIIEQALATSAFGFKATRIKSYLAGVPFRDVASVQSPASQDPVAYLQLNLSGGLSSILLLSRHYDAGSDSVVADVEVFDRLWNQIGKERIAILQQVTKKAGAVLEVAVAAPHSRHGVVLCEAVDLEGFEEAGLFESLRRRAAPFDIEKLKGSLFGWLPNSKGGAQFVDPITEVKAGVLPAVEAPTHGLRVAAALLDENPDATLFPISTLNCIQTYKEWAPLITRNEVKVVNFSATEPMDKRACESKVPKDIFGKDKSFLWVVAAGNQGITNPTLRCPQTLGTENLIVVAGAKGGGLWEYSDRGAQYSDIAADIGNPLSDDLGTSYSAARVSAVAAHLAEMFPSLSPEDIKLGILLGAHVPWNPLEVRSGGFLNVELAEAVAWELSRLPATLRKRPNAVFAQTLLQPHLNHYEVTRRLRIWKERNLIP